MRLFLLFYCSLIGIAVSLTATGRAYGSCGDWLAEPMTSDHALVSSNKPLRWVDLFDSRPLVPAGSCHCQGPQCGKAPGLPAPLPVPIPPVAERLATTKPAEDRNATNNKAIASFVPFELDATPLAGFSQGIDRPPRDC